MTTIGYSQTYILRYITNVFKQDTTQKLEDIQNSNRFIKLLFLSSRPRIPTPKQNLYECHIGSLPNPEVTSILKRNHTHPHPFSSLTRYLSGAREGGWEDWIVPIQEHQMMMLRIEVVSCSLANGKLVNCFPLP